jgi:hypothetical protein
MNRKLAIFLVLIAICEHTLADDAAEVLRPQVQALEKQIDSLERSTKQNRDVLTQLKKQVLEIALSEKTKQQRILELTSRLDALEGKQTALGGSLDQLAQETEIKGQTIDRTINNRSTWSGVGIALLLVMFGGGYWYLRHRGDASERTLTAQVKDALNTIRSTEEKIASSDTALADSLFEILNKLKIQELNAVASGHSKATEVDHHLPLKLADEIHRMRKRLAALPEDTKGLTPLQKSLERLEVELVDQGYEIVDHTGVNYTENLSVKARFVPSDDLGPDQKIVSKVVSPQVNYNGVMIRMADIEVSIGS